MGPRIGTTGPRGRTVAAVVAGILAGTVLIQPAVAHVTTKLNHLVKHLDPRYYNVGEKVGDADTLDGQSSAAFLGATAKAADADRLDGTDSAAFLQNQGPIRLVANQRWWASNGAVNVAPFYSFTQFITPAAAGSSDVVLVPDIPATMYGKSYQLTGMELCYDATSPGATLSNVQLLRAHANIGTTYNFVLVVNDATDRDDNTCRMYTGTPQTIPPNGWAEVRLNIAWTGAGAVNVNRTTLLLQPTANEVPPIPRTAGAEKVRI